MIRSGAARLLELLKNPVETVVPKGWKTIAQLAQETGLSRSTIDDLVRDAVLKGKAKERVFSIKSKSRENLPVKHYFLLGK
jgi:hypothetical protein